REKGQSDAVRVREPLDVEDPLSPELSQLAHVLLTVAARIDSEEEKIELTSAARRCEGLVQTLGNWLGQRLDGQVYWVEQTGGRRGWNCPAPPSRSGRPSRNSFTTATG